MPAKRLLDNRVDVSVDRPDTAASAGPEYQALHDFFEHAGIGMQWIDGDGIIIRANQAQLELLGYAADEYVGHHVSEFHVQAEKPAEILSALKAGEVVRNFEAQLRARDGSSKHVVIDSSGRFEDGVFVHSRCLTREIAAKALAEPAVGERDERYQALLKALPALIVTLTPSGEFEDISESYRQYTGLTLNEAKSWADHAVIHPDDMESAMRVWTPALETGEPMQNEMRLRRHDGTYRWYLVQVVPVRDTSGAILRWVTVAIDIDDRKRAEVHERYLAETTAKLVSPLDSTEMLAEIARLAVPTLADICAIGLFDRTDRTARVETAGADDRERPLVESIHLRRWLAEPGGERTIGAVISSGEPVFVRDFSPAWVEACAPDEEQRELGISIGAGSVICVPMLARGEPTGMATFATTRSQRRYTPRDLWLLTEVAARLSIAIENVRLYQDLKDTAEDLRRANAAKDEFLSLVSHELRTPITIILGNSRVLTRLRTAVDHDSLMQALDDIHDEAERLNRIIENLLVLARVERGQADLETLQVVRVLEPLIEAHRRQYPRRDVRLNIDGDELLVEGSEFCIEQSVRNLLSNAEKYSPADAPIDVTISRSESTIVVSVSDRGIGISPEEMREIFKPFYRSSKAQSVSGVGIGLTVCERLVEAQGGAIWAEAREGGGTTIAFSLHATGAADDSSEA